LQGAAPTFRIDGRSARQEVRAFIGPRRIRMFRATPALRSSAGGNSSASGGETGGAR
jgi:hypothetical protein